MFAGRLVRVRPVAVLFLLVEHEVRDAALEARFRLAEEVGDLVFLFDKEDRGLELALERGAEERKVFALWNDAVPLDFADDIGVSDHRLALVADNFAVRFGVLADGFHVKGSSAFLHDLSHGANRGENDNENDQDENDDPVFREKIGDLGHRASRM